MKATEDSLRSQPANAWMQDPALVQVVRQMQEDLQWAREHHGELERQFPGESVVIWRKQVVGHGTDQEAVLQEAANLERPREELVVVEFPTFFESPR